MTVPASTRAEVYRMFERDLEQTYPGTIWTVSEDNGCEPHTASATGEGGGAARLVPTPNSDGRLDRHDAEGG